MSTKDVSGGQTGFRMHQFSLSVSVNGVGMVVTPLKDVTFVSGRDQTCIIVIEVLISLPIR